MDKSNKTVLPQPQLQARFGTIPFSKRESQRCESLLARRLERTDLKSRAGPGGSTMSYLESHKAIEKANSIFGYDGWSNSTVMLSDDYIMEKGGRWSCGVSAFVQVTLKDGTHRQDIGYGMADNMKTQGMALEKARKEAQSDALKRTLRLFGNGLGNCAYDNNLVRQIKAGKAAPYCEGYDGPRYGELGDVSSEEELEEETPPVRPFAEAPALRKETLQKKSQAVQRPPPEPEAEPITAKAPEGIFPAPQATTNQGTNQALKRTSVEMNFESEFAMLSQDEEAIALLEFDSTKKQRF